MELIGTVVRLQVQRSRLKPAGTYDPSPLLAVDALDVGPRGAVGVTADGPVLDVHHADHPDSRNRRLVNGLSLLPLAHYDELRSRYGDHLVDGVAGESVLLETAGPWRSLDGPLLLETTGGGLLELDDPLPAAPCVEFTRFCLGGGSEDELRAALDHLDGGTRGFYVSTTGTGRVQVGARLLRA